MVVENHYPFVFLSCTPEILVIPYLQERGEPTSTSPRDARSLRLSILGHRLLAQLRCRVSLAVLMEENNTPLVGLSPQGNLSETHYQHGRGEPLPVRFSLLYA